MKFALKHVCANFEPQVPLPTTTSEILGLPQSHVQAFSPPNHYHQDPSFPILQLLWSLNPLVILYL